MSEPKEQRIAARLASEPGWRALVLKPEGEQLMMMLFEVKWWGYPAPSVELPKPALFPIMQLFGSFNASSMFGMPAPEIIPMAEDGTQLSPRWLIPPCDKSNEELLAECQAWVDKVMELNPQLKTASAPPQSSEEKP